ADALPGFGIVAAVLGIVITMGAIDGEIAAIGAHVAAALVGTFMGVFLAYGIVGPVSAVLHHLAEEEIKLYEAVTSCVIASLNGLPPQLAVEFGRKSLFTRDRPTFTEVESKVRSRGWKIWARTKTSLSAASRRANMATMVVPGKWRRRTSGCA